MYRTELVLFGCAAALGVGYLLTEILAVFACFLWTYGSLLYHFDQRITYGAPLLVLEISETVRENLGINKKWQQALCALLYLALFTGMAYLARYHGNPAAKSVLLFLSLFLFFFFERKTEADGKGID